jgi:hypothetical protein
VSARNYALPDLVDRGDPDLVNAALGPVPTVAIAAATHDAAWTTGVAGYRVNCTADCDLTGLVAGYDGEVRFLWNTGTHTVTIKASSGSSAAANRFLAESDTDRAVGPRQVAQLLYDAAVSRWRVA